MRFSNYNNETYGFSVIDVGELIANVKVGDVIYDISETGIMLNRFLNNCDSKIEFILWIDFLKEKISVERIEKDVFSGELVAEEVTEFCITDKEIKKLLEFESLISIG